MEISRHILKFLNREDVRDALRSNDTQELYKLAVDESVQGDLLDSDIGELTSILMQAGIDPLLGMTEIPVGFLAYRGDIKEFNIPRGITRIGLGAFEYTDLESITIPSSVGVIDRGAFYGCRNLKTIKLPAGVELHRSALSSSDLESVELKDVKLQGYFIFWGCKQLKSVIIKGDTPVIPTNTFESCFNLTHVELPASLKEIERSIFLGCSSLEEINFAGTVNQWKDIKIQENNAKLFSCKIICNNGVLRYDKTMKEWKQV